VNLYVDSREYEGGKVTRVWLMSDVCMRNDCPFQANSIVPFRISSGSGSSALFGGVAASDALPPDSPKPASPCGLTIISRAPQRIEGAITSRLYPENIFILTFS
jgi:hypothetical protein